MGGGGGHGGGGGRCSKCKMKRKVREHDVMDMKLGCQKNWVGRLLNPNQIEAPPEERSDALALH